MRRTPPVVVQLQPQPAVQAVVAGIAVLATAGLVAWAVSHRDAFWPALLAVPVAAYAWRAAGVLPRRLLGDAQASRLAEPGRDGETPVELAVLIDVDAWLPPRATLFSAPAAMQR